MIAYNRATCRFVHQLLNSFGWVIVLSSHRLPLGIVFPEMMRRDLPAARTVDAVPCGKCMPATPTAGVAIICLLKALEEELNAAT